MNATLRVCVVKPSLNDCRTPDALPPLLFAILAPLTPGDVELAFMDENITPIGVIDCDAAAISIDTFTARRGYTLADNLRARGVPVIIGGMHATFCPDEAAEHADTVVIGEAEDTWPTVVADLLAGSLAARYVSANAADLATVEYDYTVYAGRRYPRVGIVQFSRGCKFNCEFCSISAFYGKTLRTRPVSAVMQSIRQLPHRVVFFADDNLFAVPERMDELMTALRRQRRRWVCQISIDVAKDRALLARMRASGCMMVIMGFESLTAGNLRQMHKAVNLVADYDDAIANIRQAGLMLYGTFVIGYDDDTPGTAGQLARWAMKRGLAIANFNPLIPTPGTDLYKRLQAEGRLLSDHWWDDPSYRYGDTAFRPAGMTPGQLADSCRDARYGFYSLRGIFARMRGANAKGLVNVVVFLLMNLVSRRSIHQKQGGRLG